MGTPWPRFTSAGLSSVLVSFLPSCLRQKTLRGNEEKQEGHMISEKTLFRLRPLTFLTTKSVTNRFEGKIFSV